MFDNQGNYVLRRLIGNIDVPSAPTSDVYKYGWKSIVNTKGLIGIRREDDFTAWTGRTEMYATCTHSMVHHIQRTKRKEATIDNRNGEIVLQHMGVCRNRCSRALCQTMFRNAHHFNQHFDMRCRECVVFGSHIFQHVLRCHDAQCMVPCCGIVKHRMRMHLPCKAVSIASHDTPHNAQHTPLPPPPPPSSMHAHDDQSTRHTLRAPLPNDRTAPPKYVHTHHLDACFPTFQVLKGPPCINVARPFPSFSK